MKKAKLPCLANKTYLQMSLHYQPKGLGISKTCDKKETMNGAVLLGTLTPSTTVSPLKRIPYPLMEVLADLTDAMRKSKSVCKE